MMPNRLHGLPHVTLEISQSDIEIDTATAAARSVWVPSFVVLLLFFPLSRTVYQKVGVGGPCGRVCR